MHYSELINVSQYKFDLTINVVNTTLIYCVTQGVRQMESKKSTIFMISIDIPLPVKDDTHMRSCTWIQHKVSLFTKKIIYMYLFSAPSYYSMLLKLR